MGVKGASPAKARGKNVAEQVQGAGEIPNRHRLIRASAGSGKTYQLANHFLGVLHSGAAPERILATTFTRKAAGEILQRVMLRLADAADDDKESEKLAKEIGCGGLTAQETRACLAKLARALHRLRVCTLDSFFAQLAVAFGLELGLPPSWTIIEEQDDSQLRSQAIQTVIDKSESDVIRLMHLLSKGEARQSVTRQIRDHVDALYTIFLETDEEAWSKVPLAPMLSKDELENAIAELEALSFTDGRFTKACLSDGAKARGEKWKEFLKSGFTGAITGGQTYYKKPIDAAAIAAYEKAIAHAKGVLLAQLASQTKATYELLAKFHEEYERLKRSRGSMRFEDVTRAITRGGEADWSNRLDDVAHRLDAHVEHLLLDEFQDTSLLQWGAIEPFGRRVIGHAGSDRSFFCVGDVKQAIYGWRGGVAEIFDSIKQQFEQLVDEPLNESYRSSPVVIDVVNKVFEGVDANGAVTKNQAGVGAWRRGFEAHTTARRTYPGYCELRTAPAADTEKEQAERTLVFAADEIERIAKEAPGRSIAALVRENKAVGRLIFELRKRGIEASEEGGNPLTDSPAVMAILSALVLADHPGDTAARFHLAHSPMGRVLGYEDYKDDRAAQRMSRAIREKLLSDGYGPTLHGWTRELAADCDTRDLDRLTQLARMAHRYDEDATLRTTDFVSYVGHQRVEDPTSAAVRVMTLHQSKGLQFDCVVLPQLDKRLTGQPPTVVVGRPHPAAPIDRVSCYAFRELCNLVPWLEELHDKHRERESREAMSVLYVGMTRAIHALHMIIAPSRGSEKNVPETLAGILRCALVNDAPVPPATVLFKAGDPDWHAKAAPVAVREEASPATVKVRFAKGDESRSRRLKRAAPSGMEGGAVADLRKVLRLDDGAMSEGRLIHEWFEQVEWLDDGATVAPPPGAAHDQQSKARFEKLIANEATRAALLLSTYERPAANARRSAVAAPRGANVATLSWTVYRERSFAIREENTIVGGQIDRLVVLKDGNRVIGAEVIDFKTDAVEGDAEITERAEYYRPQIDAYRRAVARLFALSDDQVTAALLFVTPGVVRAV